MVDVTIFDGRLFQMLVILAVKLCFLKFVFVLRGNSFNVWPRFPCLFDFFPHLYSLDIALVS